MSEILRQGPTPLPEGYQYSDSIRIKHQERAELMRSAGMMYASSPKLLTSDLKYGSEGISMLDVGVRTDEGQLVGFGRVLYQGEQGEPCSLVVNPADQHNGIGKAIIDERLKRAAAAGINSFYMPFLEETNTLASYYVQIGFHETEAGEFVRGPHPVSISGMQPKDKRP